MQLALNAAMIGCVPGESSLTELDDIEALDRVYRGRLLRFVAYSTGDQDLAETMQIRKEMDPDQIARLEKHR